MSAALLPSGSARLVLAPVSKQDLDEVYDIYGDAATWRHLPSGRHRNRKETLELIENSQRSWETHGLGQWAMRISADGASGKLEEGTLIGTGGLTMTAGKVWNLGYRLTPSSWGRGFATEVATAAIAAGAVVAPEIAITGRALVNNPASGAVLKRVGLTLIWEGVRPSATSATAAHGQIYADRELDSVGFDWVLANA